MHLDPILAKILIGLGFPVPPLLPGNAYAVLSKYHEWVAGGTISPQTNSIIPDIVIATGVWLPRIEDLWEWLAQNTDSVKLIHKKIHGISCFYTKATINRKKFVSNERYTILYSLFEITLKVLMSNRNEIFRKNTIRELIKKYKNTE